MMRYEPSARQMLEEAGVEFPVLSWDVTDRTPGRPGYTQLSAEVVTQKYRYLNTKDKPWRKGQKRKDGPPVVEIRTGRFGCDMLIVVASERLLTTAWESERGSHDALMDRNVRISMNGHAELTLNDWMVLTFAVDEALQRLQELADAKKGVKNPDTPAE